MERKLGLSLFIVALGALSWAFFLMTGVKNELHFTSVNNLEVCEEPACLDASSNANAAIGAMTAVSECRILQQESRLFANPDAGFNSPLLSQLRFAIDRPAPPSSLFPLCREPRLEDFHSRSATFSIELLRLSALSGDHQEYAFDYERLQMDLGEFENWMQESHADDWAFNNRDQSDRVPKVVPAS